MAPHTLGTRFFTLLYILGGYALLGATLGVVGGVLMDTANARATLQSRADDKARSEQEEARAAHDESLHMLGATGKGIAAKSGLEGQGQVRTRSPRLGVAGPTQATNARRRPSIADYCTARRVEQGL